MGLGDYLIRTEVKHERIRLCRAEHRATGEPVYLVAEPEELHLLVGHPGLPGLGLVGMAEGLRWQVGGIPSGPSLKELWRAQGLNTESLADCLIQVVDALAHLASNKPLLLPHLIYPEQIIREANGRWVLDFIGLAMKPSVRLGAGGSVIKAFGNILRQLEEGGPANLRSGAVAPLRHFSPAVRLIMMRCQWGGFGSLEEVRHALVQLKARPTEEAAASALPAPLPQVAARPPAKREKAGPRGTSAPFGQQRALPFRLPLGYAAALAVLVLVGAAALALRSFGRTTEQSAIAPSQPSPALATDSAGSGASSPSPLPAPPLDDLRSGKRRSPSERAPESQAPQVVSPAPPPPVQPTDPVDQADKATAGDNLVAVRLYGYTIGRVYMLTNPGAPVISLDSFARILKRPVTGSLKGPGELLVEDGDRRFTTKSFVILNNRIWLVLKPELVAAFGFRIETYGQGVMDLAPVLP